MPKHLLDLGRCECRWPVNDEAPFLFCAEPTEMGLPVGPYCRAHLDQSVAAVSWPDRLIDPDRIGEGRCRVGERPDEEVDEVDAVPLGLAISDGFAMLGAAG